MPKKLKPPKEGDLLFQRYQFAHLEPEYPWWIENKEYGRKTTKYSRWLNKDDFVEGDNDHR